MIDETNNSTPGMDAAGFEKIGQKGRVEWRMVTDDQEVTAELAKSVIDEIEAYRDDNPGPSGPLSWSKLADLVGISATTLSEIRGGKYRASQREPILKIDQFLADMRARAGRMDFRTTAKLSMTDAIEGTIRTSIRLNTMGVVIGSPGVGKSAHARAFASQRSGVATIRIDEKHANSSGVTSLLCRAIEPLRGHASFRPTERVASLTEWLRKHGSTVIIVDECQKLDRTGLEMLRDIHDISDPATHRNVPIVFFGDQGFLKLIFKARAGERSPISAQCIRRMRPVLNIDTDCRQDDGGGLYSVDDIVTIVRNSRVKLLTPKAVRWVRDLANVIEYGALGNAMGVLQLAVDLAIPPGGEWADPIDVDMLQEALNLTFGKSVAIEIDERAHGSLLRKVAG